LCLKIIMNNPPGNGDLNGSSFYKFDNLFHSSFCF
ncbi:hypothetical protein T03_4237, partial [Trichinella britovi]